MRAGGTCRDHRVVGTHQPVFDLHLPGDQIDQSAMNEVT
jgi:hypothetical protein